MFNVQNIGIDINRYVVQLMFTITDYFVLQITNHYHIGYKKYQSNL